jgi:hypothetical protein
MHRPASEKHAINKALASHGLGTLDSGAGLLAQLGYLVDSHDEFRDILTKCEPSMRRDAYESLRPYLRFDAKPLDVYIAESADLAARKQLPTIAADGTLKPYGVPEIKAGCPHCGTVLYAGNPHACKPKSQDLETAQNAIAEAVAKVHLNLVCKQCTREASFPGVTRPEALASARRAGWKQIDEDAERCPVCLGY